MKMRLIAVGVSFAVAAASPALAEQKLDKSIWVDIPGGAMNGNVQNIEDVCIMKAGTPIARTKSGVDVYAPGKVTYGSECPAGIPVSH